jgi:hypothetical protein
VASQASSSIARACEPAACTAQPAALDRQADVTIAIPPIVVRMIDGVLGAARWTMLAMAKPPLDRSPRTQPHATPPSPWRHRSTTRADRRRLAAGATSIKAYTASAKPSRPVGLRAGRSRWWNT